MKEIKLYSPVEISMYDGNSFMPEDLLTNYFIKDAQKAINEAQKSHGQRGLMKYFDSEKYPLVDEKVNSIHINLEVVEHNLVGVTTIFLNSDKPLSSKEMKIVKDYIEGQMSDGFGESFEQQPISIEGGEIYISLWSDYCWGLYQMDYIDSANKGNHKPDAPIIGADGNIFNILSIAKKALKENGQEQKANKMASRVMASESYYEALQIISEYTKPVEVNKPRDKSNNYRER